MSFNRALFRRSGDVSGWIGLLILSADLIFAPVPAIPSRADESARGVAQPSVPPLRRSASRRSRSRPGDKIAGVDSHSGKPAELNVPRGGKEIYERLLDSTAWVVIRQADKPDVVRWGTGWILDADRHLLVTNQHVVSGGADDPRAVVRDAELTIYFPWRENGKLVTERARYLRSPRGVKGTVFDADVERDLAIIQLESLPVDSRVLPLAAEGAGPGDTIHSLGNPGASDALWVYTSGTVRQVYRARSVYEHGVVREFLRVETQSPTNPGDSGGPVVNDRNELVAVNQGYFSEGRLISWFVDASEVRSFLQEIESLIDPATAEGFNERGVHYYDRGRYDRAISDLTEAVRRDPKLADAYNNRGWAFLKTADETTALADFDAAIALNPRDATYFEGRAQARLEHADHDGAISDLTTAIQLDPDNADLYRQRGNALHAADRNAEAIADLGRAISREPENADFYNDRGVIYYDLDDYDEAIADYTRAIDLNSNDAVYFCNRANASAADDDLLAAAADYFRMEQLDPQFARQHREKYGRRYLKIANRGTVGLRVHVRYHTQTDDGEWGWFPADEGTWVKFEFAPGEESYLGHEGFRINADEVRIWAETVDGRMSWQQYRTTPLRLMEDGGYEGYLMATFTLDVGVK